MRKGKPFLWVFFILVFLSIAFIFLSKKGTQFSIFTPVQKLGSFITGGALSAKGKTETEKLKEENRNLLGKLTDFKRLEEENKALRFQFENQTSKNLKLLPAKIVGAPGFIPNKSLPVYFVIDKGENDGVKKEQAVIFGENVVGEVESINSEFSRVKLVYDSSFAEVARIRSMNNKNTQEVFGLVRGQSDGNLLIDNVLPSSNLEKGDVLETRGSENVDGTGFPPGLILGKVTSVEDKKSAVFKKAGAESLLNFINLSDVFIVVSLK